MRPLKYITFSYTYVMLPLYVIPYELLKLLRPLLVQVVVNKAKGQKFEFSHLSKQNILKHSFQMFLPKNKVEKIQDLLWNCQK